MSLKLQNKRIEILWDTEISSMALVLMYFDTESWGSIPISMWMVPMLAPVTDVPEGFLFHILSWLLLDWQKSCKYSTRSFLTLTPWKEIYDQPRQFTKKQRRYFANKGPSRQGYGFSSGHVRMWELDYKESWVQKNWCFWTVVLEKTFESPLDCKEIQAVHPKGNQSWIFTGRTDAEAETPILWQPDAKNQLIEKDPDAGKDWGQQEKGTTEDEMVGWHHQVNGHEFE